MKSMDKERGLKQVQFAQRHREVLQPDSPPEHGDDKQIGHDYHDDDDVVASSFEVVGTYDDEVVTAGNALDDDKMVNLGLKIWIDPGGGPQLEAGYSPLSRVRGQTEGKMRTPGRRTPGRGSQTRGAHSGEQSVEYDLGTVTEDIYAE